MNKKSLQNLRKYSELTTEEIKTMSSNGGKKGAETKRKRKALREELLALLSAKVVNDDGKKETMQKKISVALINKAIAGDTKAFEVIRDTIGEKPTDKIEQVNQTPSIVVATQEQADLIKQIQNVKINENI